MMLTAEYLRERLHYDPETGVFTWRSKPVFSRFERIWNTRFAGKVAGHLNKFGYVTITVDNEHYYAQRLAWLYVHGEWPPELVDHKDRDAGRSNALRNLRPASKQQNGANMRLRSNNTSGRKGVYWHHQGRKWAARVKVRGKDHHLGLFDDIDKAAAAYLAAAERHFGEFATTGV